MAVSPVYHPLFHYRFPALSDHYTMPTKKKRAFTKKNSTKYMVLHGHESALNADGKTLEHEWVEIKGNYKPGASLIMGKLAELMGESDSPVPHASSSTRPNMAAQPSREPDLEAILNQFEDASGSEDEDVFSNMKKELKKIQLPGGEKLNPDDFIVEEEYEDDDDLSQDEADDFSDAGSDLSETSSPDNSTQKQKSCPKYMVKKLEEYDDFFSSLEQNSPENLNTAKEKIEKKMEEYEEDQIGPLEDEEIFGYLTGENEHIDYYLGKKKLREEDLEIGKCDDTLREKILKYSEEDHVEKLIEIVTEHPVEFDCESIISTYSNKYNHPSIIREEGKIRKIKIPNNPLQKQLTKSKLKQLESESESEEYSDDDAVSVASTINIRPKGETPEQRLERKKFFKQVKSENRKLKKENKIAFKNEKKFQQTQAMNVQNNRGIRLF
ncbi:protein LTV1 homolog isoform X2 [Parasteatoda tepidariorum]|uniref:protein LTV1 homolog isoform X2 n=1 Tax=Parasteatoda tepidariorum TaxID=114398 RepID=UPI0039BD930C